MRKRGFTLVELAVALLVLAILLAGLAMPLATQVQLRRHEETRRLLEDAREALLGFAAANGRLPCPSTEGSRGEESFAPGGSAADGRCARLHDGFLPGAALGLAPLDGEGFVRDAWGTERNRIRYAVAGNEAVNGIEHAFTRANGLQAATLAGLGDAPRLLLLCVSGAGTTATGCGPAANQLTRRAAFVLHASGANAPEAVRPGGDEAENLDGDAVFVSAPPRQGPDPFDDLLTWVPATVLASRLLAAGRLP